MAVVPYSKSSDSKKLQVAAMFNNIARRYDLLNRVLSFGIDIYWRKKALGLLQPYKPSSILDVATGTCDLAIDAVKYLKPQKVVGIDIADQMLSLGAQKLKAKNLDSIVSLENGDSENLRFEGNFFDSVVVAFGVRNFENLEKGLMEMNRVTKPGGTLMVLEFSQPTNKFLAPIYWWYCNSLMPFIGKMLSKDDSAYRYLPESVKVFPSGLTFASLLKQAGYSEVRFVPLTFGIATAYLAVK